MDSEVHQLHSRAASLAAEFKQGGRKESIDEAIELDREALKLWPPDHPMRALSLSWLSFHLSDRYDQCGAMANLEEAIAVGREALALIPPGHPQRSTSLDNLARHLSGRFDRLGVTMDLDEAIALCREALVLCPPGNPDHSTCLNNLAHHLSSRYNRLGATVDLDEAIFLCRGALALYPPGNPGRSTSLNNLASNLSNRYNQRGAMVDLDEAIVLSREGLALCLPRHPRRPTSLNNLAICLSRRYSQLGVMADLDEAIALCREALVLRPPGHPLRSTSISSLASYFFSRYNQLGVMVDLDEAIVLSREALVLLPPGNPDRSMSLNNFALCLSTRYDQLGAMVDLDEAIILCREALTLCPPGRLDRATSLNNLAHCLSGRYNQLRAMVDLEEALVLSREALALRPPGHPDRSNSLQNLAGYLSIRYEQLGMVVDLDEAIVLCREALGLCPQGHPLRSSFFNNLAYYLCYRYKQLGTMVDLDEAVVLARGSLALCPLGHPRHSMSLKNLANHLGIRFARTNELEDKDDMFSLYGQIVSIPQVVSSDDLSASRAWIRVAEALQHPTTLLAYETSLQLLTHHLATLPSLPQHLKVVKNITSSLAVDAFSACLRNCSPAKAVELLEQGRGVFWSQLTRLRSPLDDVIASSPEGETLADKFRQLTSLIHNALDSPGADQHDRVWHLNVELEKVVSSIRKLPGLSRFFLPLLFSDLQQAAIGGPVIIVNASKYSCDALIVLHDREPIHVPLKIRRDDVRALSSQLYVLTVRAKRMDVTRELVGILREIWDHVVSPIVDVLQTIHPFQSRIWWCPTAEFCILPLHVAGAYRTGQRRLSSLYISSYTTTLAALIRARLHASSNSGTELKRFVAIGQANAMGKSTLNSVGAELANIGERVKSLMTFKSIEGSDSCISRVTEELYENEWVHLACHGLPNRKEPFESAFGLHDGRFTIERLIRRELPNAEFAYLSACHTTVGDEDGPDEMIHLASAMQFAGFRSVIGTMWAVDDNQTNKITSMFYDNMKDESGRLDHTRAAFALHKTMSEVKGISFDQRILYVHLGA